MVEPVSAGCRTRVTVALPSTAETEHPPEHTNEPNGNASIVSTTQVSPTLEIPLGVEVNTGQAVNWLPGRQSNGFFLVLGASGSGKTETLKVLGKGVSDFGIPVLILDFHGDVTFPGLRSVLMSSGTSSVIGINPMELDSKKSVTRRVH